jgi:hypothetical protein
LEHVKWFFLCVNFVLINSKLYLINYWKKFSLSINWLLWDFFIKKNYNYKIKRVWNHKQIQIWKVPHMIKMLDLLIKPSVCCKTVSGPTSTTRKLTLTKWTLTWSKYGSKKESLGSWVSKMILSAVLSSAYLIITLQTTKSRTRRKCTST